MGPGTCKKPVPVKKVTILQWYAPTERFCIVEKDTFYGLWHTVQERLRTGDITIETGDLNAKVSSDNTLLAHGMGKHGLGSICRHQIRFFLV